ncbi:tellurite resistance TerB family protein [Archangium lansingense]|uniref:TerB family tellurite resistance protein n=1 Tax=Archangium lansingense TaxID=2995310 RepID=A0ABT4AMM0_9BACT|nr:TerB family tellurite resistance protein [Archangium lansinium]MCY1082928.1 TerB family tellurite resistance protein [Archangium lansinium]
MTTPTDDRFYIELLKLLLHVAWSDDELKSSEAQALIGAAQRWKVPLPELQRLERCLETGEPLPAPNLGLLRQRADEVLATVRTLIASDSEVHFSEEEMLAQIRELLGLSS